MEQNSTKVDQETYGVLRISVEEMASRQPVNCDYTNTSEHDKQTVIKPGTRMNEEADESEQPSSQQKELKKTINTTTNFTLRSSDAHNDGDTSALSIPGSADTHERRPTTAFSVHLEESVSPRGSRHSQHKFQTVPEEVNEDRGRSDYSLTNEEVRLRCKQLEEKVKMLTTELVKVEEIAKKEQREKIRATEEDNISPKTLVQLQERCVAYKSQIREQTVEIEELKTRLSRIMSQRVTDNNPDITDLSDQNRPTKLAERYAELYSNEWSDAFEQLEQSGHRHEKKIIRTLLKMLTKIYSACRERANEQLENLKTAVAQFSGRTELPDDVKMALKQIKDNRKFNFSKTMPLYLTGTDVLSEQLMPIKDRNQAVLKYIKLATELCWLMSIQEPQVFMQTKFKKGDPFNKDVYYEYTTTGKKNRYLIWPAIYLFEGGQLLRKGVAQPQKMKNTTDVVSLADRSQMNPYITVNDLLQEDNQEREVSDNMHNSKRNKTKKTGHTSKVDVADDKIGGTSNPPPGQLDIYTVEYP